MMMVGVHANAGESQHTLLLCILSPIFAIAQLDRNSHRRTI